jgi:hypothetical protein
MKDTESRSRATASGKKGDDLEGKIILLFVIAHSSLIFCTIDRTASWSLLGSQERELLCIA